MEGWKQRSTNEWVTQWGFSLLPESRYLKTKRGKEKWANFKNRGNTEQFSFLFLFFFFFFTKEQNHQHFWHEPIITQRKTWSVSANALAYCHLPPAYYSPLMGFHWRDRCSYAHPIVKNTVHCVHTIYNTHNRMYEHPLPPMTIVWSECVYVCVCRGGYSGTQGNGTWGYSGLNGSSGYTAAHKVPCMCAAETNAPVHTMSRSTTKDRCVRVTKLSPCCLGLSEWQALSISRNLAGWSECLKRATSNRSGESQVPDANAGIAITEPTYRP